MAFNSPLNVGVVDFDIRFHLYFLQLIAKDTAVSGSEGNLKLVI